MNGFKPGDRAIIVGGELANRMKIVVVDGPWVETDLFKSPDLPPYGVGVFSNCDVLVTSLGQPIIKRHKELRLTAHLKTTPYNASCLRKLPKVEDPVEELEVANQ